MTRLRSHKGASCGAHARIVTRVLVAAALCLIAAAAGAQTFSQRGFVDARGTGFFEKAPNDQVQGIADLLFREEVFVKPAQSDWLRLEAGVDFRANSHDQVEDEWRLDFEDRGIRRPRVAVRRLAVVMTAGKLTVEAGKQFIRWGRADILNPTDRLAPRDYLNVLDADFLPVLGVRPTLQLGTESIEGVFVPRFTPSRLPLFNQRWTVLPPEAEAAGVRIIDTGALVPDGSQQGVRWNHAGEKFEMALSFFDGFNHLATVLAEPRPGVLAVALKRTYAALRSYGGDVAIPTAWFTLKGEAAYLQSPGHVNEDYVLYVIEIERQVGEWVLVGGYAGDVVTTARDAFRFAPDRGVARSILGRVSYTVDPRRTVSVEGAARQSGDGYYLKGEYSQAVGQHVRLTGAGVVLAGNQADFLGQFRRNSNVSGALRVSF